MVVTLAVVCSTRSAEGISPSPHSNAGPNVTPAGAFNVVPLPTKNTSGVGALVGFFCNCPGPNPAMPNGDAELSAARSPYTSNAIPFGATSVALLLTVALASVIFGVGLPVAAICDRVNSTTVLAAPALLDHRFPYPSNASAHGAWIDPLLFESVTVGVSETAVGPLEVTATGVTFRFGKLDALKP